MSSTRHNVELSYADNGSGGGTFTQNKAEYRFT